MIGNHIFLILNWSREKIQKGKNVADKTQSMRKSKGYEKDKKKKKGGPPSRTHLSELPKN